MAPDPLLSVYIYSSETGINKKFSKYLYLMHTFTIVLYVPNKHLLSIYSMPDAALSPVAIVVKQTDPVLTELCGGWIGFQGLREEEAALYTVYHS